MTIPQHKDLYEKIYLGLLIASTLSIFMLFVKKRFKASFIKIQKSYCRITLWLHYIISFNLIMQLVSNFVQYFVLFTNIIKPKFFLYWISYMTPIIIEISFITVITQSYEWFVVWHVIMWQKDKSLGEMLYLLDSDTISKFQKREKLIFVCFIALMVLLITLRIVQRS